MTSAALHAVLTSGGIDRDALEVVAGFPIGGGMADLPAATRGPRAVLEARLRDALQRTPCVITFSGGRDSSALLALAVHVARRDGLPEPIAVTRRHPGVEDADETAWQNHVASHIGLRNWVKIDADDEFDVIGPYAQQVMAEHGPTWPPMAHSHLPFLELAHGGSYVTGEGGDEVLGTRRMTIVAVLRRKKERLSLRHLEPLALALGPRALRRRLLRRYVRDARRDAWLRPEVARLVDRAFLEADLDEPLEWVDAIRYDLGHRKRTLAAPVLEAQAAREDAMLSMPFLDPEFVAALARPAGRWGFCCRGCAMSALFRDVLPAEVLYRESKATFAPAMFSTYTRRFAASWDGTHPYGELVHVEALRREWLGERPHAGTIPLLQHAWYAAVTK